MKVWTWLDITIITPHTIKGFAFQVIYGMGSNKVRDLLALIFWVVIWYLWIWRNNLCFKDTPFDKEHMLDCVQMHTLLWIKGKSPGSAFATNNWIQEPWACMYSVWHTCEARRIALRARRTR